MNSIKLIVLVSCTLLMVSCGGGDSAPVEPPPTPVPTSVALSAATVTLRMGETSQLTATVRDQLGRPMSGQVIGWASSDTTRVTITGGGLTRGVRPGTATLTASSGALTSHATGTVLAPQLVVEEGASVTQAIGMEGGTVSGQAANGTLFTLTVPAIALLETTDITLTPVTTIQNLPAGTTLVTAVRLRPDGLTFLSPATVTMDLPAGVSATNLVGLRFADDGSALRLTPITSMGTRLTLTLSHFSGAGAATSSNPPLIPLTGGGTVADDAQSQLMQQELNAQASGSYDIPAITTIFRTWYANGVRLRLQNGAIDEASLGGAISGWAEWRDAIVTFQPTIAGTLDAALTAEQAEGRALAATALQAAIQRNNASCTAQQDLAAARKVFVWQAIAEDQALATSANALDRPTVLSGLCVQVAFGQITMPEPLPAQQPATLRVQAGVRFGPGATVYLTNPTVDVRMTATGATDGAAQHHQTDAIGNAQAPFTPTGGAPLVIALHACINDPVGIGLTLFEVCRDMTVTRTVQSITVSPSAVSVTAGATQQFTANVWGISNTAVNWTATGGTISPTGLYTAGQTSGTFEVKATSVAEPLQSATAQVIIGLGPIRFVRLTSLHRSVFIRQPFPGPDCIKDINLSFQSVPPAQTIPAATCTFNSQQFNTGTASTTASASYTLNTQNGQSTLTITGTTSAQYGVSGSDGFGSANAQGFADFGIEFEVVGASVSFTLSGSLSSALSNSLPASDAGAYINFDGPRDFAIDEYAGRLGRPCTNSPACVASNPPAIQYNRSGVLAPGRYNLALYARSSAYEQTPGGGSVTGTAGFTITLTLRP